MDPQAQIIHGQGLIEMLHDAIRSRRMCRMEIPRTGAGWITLLLGIEKEEGSYRLRVDRVTGFEEALSRSRSQDISLEFLERSGVPCQFRTEVIACRPDAIWTELPKVIHRDQKRAFFRAEALSGTEILFHIKTGDEVRGRVKDYSLGGAAFLMGRNIKLDVGEEVTDIHLKLPRGKNMREIQVPSGVVRRMIQDFQGENLCALEFREMPEATKEQLWHHIFEEQRSFLKKIKRI